MTNHTHLTETRNPASADIDLVPTLELVRIINAEDAQVAAAVGAEEARIAAAIDGIVARMRRGGRLIYVGAGTSGRLGVLDASECPPTYSVPPGLVIGLIAGGPTALTNSIEGAEDRPEVGAYDVAALNVSDIDTVVGIAASGRTPYTLGAMEEAKRRGALVLSVTCNGGSPMAAQADIAIEPLVGPEVVTGSTRMKAGTAQKLVLNILSTGVMIQLGKTFGNLMVDVQPSNAKLQDRARRIVAGGEVKTAILAQLLALAPDAARVQLAAAGGVIRRAIAADHDEARDEAHIEDHDETETDA
jgi:N-acetylmuramic acid 6-phosphate etherase